MERQLKDECDRHGTDYTDGEMEVDLTHPDTNFMPDGNLRFSGEDVDETLDYLIDALEWRQNKVGFTNLTPYEKTQADAALDEFRQARASRRAGGTEDTTVVLTPQQVDVVVHTLKEYAKRRKKHHERVQQYKAEKMRDGFWEASTKV